jgi:hypothetical protein
MSKAGSYPTTCTDGPPFRLDASFLNVLGLLRCISTVVDLSANQVSSNDKESGFGYAQHL